MISENSLSAIALSFSILGLCLAFVFASLETPLLLKISQAENSNGQLFKVNARVVSVFFSKNTLRLTLFDGNSLSAVVYNPSTEELEASEKGNLVFAVGSLRKELKASTMVVSRLWKSD